jgi:predicted O-linked N-acetylglucosamine transferase (SPINDLY family)
MGVPVVTLAGETLVSRQSASLLAACGLDDLVAGDVEGYIETTVRLAGDAARRATLRGELRERARHGFADPARYARAFEDAIEALWRDSG